VQANYQNKFAELKCCVIVPTYNNAKTLAKVIDGLLEYTNNIFVVNDGSTDNTAHILSDYKQITQIALNHNRGKGNALKTGFRAAVKAGYTYAITIDSDGQHMPSDLPKFLEKIENEPGSLIIGARNMNQEGIPGKSSFGNRFSNFWFHVDTGIKLPDTQSGYRLYPIDALSKLKYFTRKFEFEIEIIVRAAWKGVPVTSIPIEVFYAQGEERVSHFRPFKDFFRISVLNTVLFILALLIYRPVLFIRSFSLKKIFGAGESTLKLALAIGFGAFMGIVPIWGYQMLTATFLAHLMRLNKTLVLVASNISFGPLIAVFIYFSFVVGSLFVDNPISLKFDNTLNLDAIKIGAYQYLIGSVLLALSVGIIMFLISFGVISFKRRSFKQIATK
jgi:glycosyltransferase involved in cell wall biosynthesis